MSRIRSRDWPGPPRLRYVELPNPGPPLLLLHGLSRWWIDYVPLCRRVMDEWQLVFLDHPGHGRSAHAPGGYLVVDYIRHAAAFLIEHFTEPVVLYGHSLGAMVALGLAAECPDHVAGAILEDPPFQTMGKGIAKTPYRDQFTGMQEVARRGGPFDQMVESFADIRLPGNVRLGDTRERDALLFGASCLRHVDPEIFTPVIAGHWLNGYDHAALACCVKRPLLVLQGDPECGGTLTEADAAHFPRRIFFPGVGHQIHTQKPDRVLAILHDFRHELFG